MKCILLAAAILFFPSMCVAGTKAEATGSVRQEFSKGIFHGSRGHRGHPGAAAIAMPYAFASGNSSLAFDLNATPCVFDEVQSRGVGGNGSPFLIEQAGDYAIDLFVNVITAQEDSRDRSVVRAVLLINSVPTHSFALSNCVMPIQNKLSLSSCHHLIVPGLVQGDTIALGILGTSGTYTPLVQGEVLRSLAVRLVRNAPDESE